MQFCQPPFQPTGFPNYGQPYGFSTPTPNQYHGYPDILGEGNVASVISPDGSTQLMFFPTLQWPQWRSFPQNPYLGNLNNPYINTLGAWFVRNIFNPIQPTVLPQLHQDCFGLQYPRSSASDCCLNLSPPGLPLKFHNDMCTSTTDIHYFIPKQFNWFRNPTGCVAVQVACPVQTTATACDYEVCCTKPCNCSPAKPCNCVDHKEEKKDNVKCSCIKVKASNSQMSIDSRSKHHRRKQKSRKSKRTHSKNSCHKCECIEPHSSDRSISKSVSRMSIESTKSNRSRCKEKSRKSKKSSHKCECREPSGCNKCVTTYADQGIGCSPEKGQETQTACSNSAPQASKGACNSMCRQAELWAPKPCTSKHAMSESTVSFGRYKDISGSCTSCSSGTE